MRIISGIQPTGQLTLGNYIGMLMEFKKYQNDNNECFIFVADLHALTLPIKSNILSENTKNIIAFYLASGIDIKKTIIFLQSDVSAHAELFTILQNFLYIGELKRMTQFKNKTKLMKKKMIGLGLFTYPVLMIADIVLYNADIVPVGEDQRQHIELTRKLVKRFNKYYGNNILTLPKIKINKIGKRIMCLNNPKNKMSKSNPKGAIFLTDSADIINKKIMHATTDNDIKIKYDFNNKPGISNLLVIYSSIKNISIKEAEKKFENYNYYNFKKEVANTIINELEPIQKKYQEILNTNIIDKVLNDGMIKANNIANIILKKIKRVVGFYKK